MPDDYSDRIDQVAAGPSSVSGDAGSVTEQSLSQLIEADKYKRSKEAGAVPSLGLRFRRISPPGSA